MALTNSQLEAYYGNFLRLLVNSLSTPAQLAHLAETMRLLVPAGKRYVTQGVLGTQAERLEAMTTFRDKAYEKLYGVNPEVNPSAAHYAQQHWFAGEE